MSLIERFLNACKLSDLENVKHCLERGVDLNTVSEIGPEEERLAVSGLTIAAGMDYLELLEWTCYSLSLALMSNSFRCHCIWRKFH